MNIIDPFNLSGLAGSSESKKRTAYNKSIREYNKLYAKAVKKGIPLDLLGYPKPKVILKSAGTGFSIPALPPGLDIPTLVPINGVDLPESSATELQQHTADLQTLIDEMDNPPTAENKHDNPPTDTNAESPSSGKSQGTWTFTNTRDFQDEPETKISINYPEVERVSLFTGNNSKERRELKEKYKKRGVDVVSAGILTKIIESLTTEGTVRDGGGFAIIRTPAHQEEFRNIIRSYTKGNEDFTNRILRILNKYGVRIGNSNKPSDVKRIVKELKKNNSTQALAELSNDISQAMITEADSRPQETRNMRALFPPINTSNLQGETVSRGDQIPISEISELKSNITNILTNRGVSEDIAQRYTERIISNFSNITALLIGREGSIESGRILSADIFGEHIGDLADILQDLNRETHINIFNTGQLLLQTLFQLKSAIPAVMLMSSEEKIKIFRDLADALSNPREEKKEEDMESLSDDFRGEGLGFPEEKTELEQNYMESLSAANDSRIDNALDEVIPRVEEGTGNIIMTDPYAIADVMSKWSNKDTIISRGGFRVGNGPPDDEGNPMIRIEAPGERRRDIPYKKFILSLVILGVAIPSITAIVKAIKDQVKGISHFIIPPRSRKSSTSDNDNKIDNPTKDYNLDNIISDKKESDMSKIAILNSKKAIQPLNKNFKMPQLDIEKLSTPNSTIKAIPITDEMRKAGLTDRIELYNSYVNQFNQASVNKDNFDKAHWQNKILNITRLIEGQTGQAREDTAASVGKTMSIDLPVKEATIQDGMYLYMNKDLVPIILTDDMIKKGYTPTINLFNEYVANYNKANEIGDKVGKLKWKQQLSDLSYQSKQPNKTGVSDLKTSDFSDNNLITSVFNTAQMKLALKQAMANGASPEELARLKLQYTENLAYQQSISALNKADAYPKTYLEDPTKEVFPTTQEEATKFNKLQDLERRLHTYINPNDKGNQALSDYNASLVSDLNPKDYQARIDKLNEIYAKYGISSIATTSEESKDDEFSTISNTVESNESPSDARDFPDNQENILNPDELIGGEALVLLSTQLEQQQEEERWKQYSLIQRGFGNGKNNSLFLENLRDEQHRFKNLQQPKMRHQPLMAKVTSSLDFQQKQNQPIMTPTYQFNTGFQDVYENNVFNLTPENINNIPQHVFENNRSSYFPDHVLDRVMPKATRILPVRMDGQRFANYGYKYGELRNRVNEAVSNENIPYNNAKGFSTNKFMPSYEYEMAKKRY